MDKFLKRTQQKSVVEFPQGHRVLGVIGKSGIGKSWLVFHMFEGGRYIELDYEILKSKQKTIDFLDKVRSTDIPVIMDEYENLNELIGLRELTGPPSLGMFVIASQIEIQFDFEIFQWYMPHPTLDHLIEIGKTKSNDIQKIRKLANICNGDIRRVIQGLDFESDEHDNFASPKEFIHSMLCRNDFSPGDFIGDQIYEHGYIWGVVQENYIDARNLDMDGIADIAHMMSRASLIDDKIYEGNWDLMPYFAIEACIGPAVKIDSNLEESEMRPGSLWTKFQNARMRQKKVRILSRRALPLELDIHGIMVLRDYCAIESQHAPGLLADYSIVAQDLDVINHLALKNKLKVKVITSLKKCLKTANPS